VQNFSSELRAWEGNVPGLKPDLKSTLQAKPSTHHLLKKFGFTVSISHGKRESSYEMRKVRHEFSLAN
jgi:hypothetical protein